MSYISVRGKRWTLLSNVINRSKGYNILTLKHMRQQKPAFGQTAASLAARNLSNLATVARQIMPSSL